MADVDLIKRNLTKMVEAGAPEADLDAYLSSEGFKSADEWRAASAGPKAAPKPVGAAMESPRLEPGPRTSTMPNQQPSWGEVAGNALANLPGSIWRDAIVPTYEAVTQRPRETLEAIPKVIVGAIEHLPQPRMTEAKRNALAAKDARSPEHAAAREEAKALAAAVGQDFVDAYGSEEALKNTLANKPGRALMDVATVGAAGAGLPGKVGQVASVASKLDPLTMGGNVLKYGAKGAEAVGSNALGITTGAGTESIRAAGRAGREGGEAAKSFTENMRGAPVSDVVGRAKVALDQVRADRSAAYKTGMKNVEEVERVLPFQPIDEALAGSKEVASFKGVELNPSAASTKDEISSIVNDWRTLNPNSPLFKDVPKGDLTPENFHTPLGLDALKRLVGDVRDSTDFGTPARAAAERVYNTIGAEIRKAAPEYAKVMAEYSSASDKLGEASRTFSLGERATGDTAARKLLSATRNNVQTNYGERKRLLNVLAEQDPTLPEAIAGQSLNALAPRGLVARGGGMLALGGMLADPASSLAYLAASSPRIVGETVYAGGKAVGLVDDVAAALGITPARLRALEAGGYQGGQADLADRGRRLRNTNALAVSP